MEWLQSELVRLRAENSRLTSLLQDNGIAVSDPPYAHTSSFPTSPSVLRLHYLYASPLVLLDNLGSTVIETFDPLRVSTEFRRISESVDGSAMITVATPTNLLHLKHTLEQSESIDPFFSTAILHVSMHTVEGKFLRCALEDENGRGTLMSPEDFCDSLGLFGVRLVFVNSCKSREIGEAVLRKTGQVSHVVCLGQDEPVLESTALVFASEFYPSLLRPGTSVAEAFNRGKLAVKTSAKQKIAQQSHLFELLPEGALVHLQPFLGEGFTIDSAPRGAYCPVGQAPGHLASAPFWLGHVGAEETPEDFTGRQVDMVRLCGIMYSGRRVCGVSGVEGVGKSSFLSEIAKFLGSPGGRHFSGGVCVIRLPRTGNGPIAQEEFVDHLADALRRTVEHVKNWYKTAQPQTVSSLPAAPVILADDFATSADLKSYKVFWADTFPTAPDLGDFLKSYLLHLPADSVAKLFEELRCNGTQLQDWGAGKIVRVVHVIRCLIPGRNDKYLLERKPGERGLLAKKFDPVTENVLEVAAMAIRKELGPEVVVSKVVLRNRKPYCEIHNSSPSYPGLTTKYVLYTADVAVADGLPLSDHFETVEIGGSKKLHSWEWVQAVDCVILQKILLDYVPPSVPVLEMQLQAGNTVVHAPDSKTTECMRLLKEWASLVENVSRGVCASLAASGLFLLQAEEYMKLPAVRQLLGNALAKHPFLKILFTVTDTPAAAGPIHNLNTASVSYKVVHFPLPPLQPIDAAVLFTRRIHRPLFPRDWCDLDDDACPPPPICGMPEAAAEEAPSLSDECALEMSTKSSKGVTNLAKLARHPLLLRTGGVPAKILHVAQHVTSDVHSINDLVHLFQ